MIYLLLLMSPLLINAQILITELSDGINDQGISIKYIDGAKEPFKGFAFNYYPCLLYTSPSPRDVEESRMPSSA